MTPRTDVVLLIHGLGRSPLSMWPLARALKGAGFAVQSWGYNSLKGGIDDKVADLRLRLMDLKGYRRVHGVGHSLGGLILRGLFTPECGLPLGRVVFIGTPQKGARMVNRHPRLFDHAHVPRLIRELRAGSPAIAALGVPPMDAGVIAGVQAFSPLNPVSWINRKILGDVRHDGTVETDSTHLPGMKDYCEVAVNHSLLPFSPRVIRHTVHFLRKGHFAR